MPRMRFIGLMLLGAISSSICAQTYCVPQSTGINCAIDEYISNVTLLSLNNNSTCVPTPGYEDFTSSVASTNIVVGGTYAVSVTIGNYWSTDMVGIFLDLNQNSSFQDAGELLTTLSSPMSGSGTMSLTLTGNVTVPATALTGTTRLRVRLVYGNFPTSASCGNTPFGNTEDYTAVLVSPPSVTITSLSPNMTTLAFAGLTSTVSGTGFTAQSVARFDGTAVPTFFVNSTTLSMSVDPPYSTTAATYAVTVFDPANGTSNSLPFSVVNPVPTINSICPCGLPPIMLFAGQGNQPIVIDGAIFATTATVLLNGSPVPTTFIDRFTLNCTIPAALMANPGTVSVSVVNPMPGGGTSNVVVMPVNGPLITGSFGPALPIPIAPTSSNLLFLGGNFFNNSSVIYLDGVPQATVVIDQFTVRFTLNQALPQLQTRGAIVLNVVNFGTAVSNSLAVPVGTASNQGTIRRSPIAPTPGTAYSLLLENGTPGQAFTLIADAAGTAPAYPWPSPAAGFVLAVSPVPVPGLWFPLADGIGIYGPASGLSFDANGRQVGFSLVLPNPPLNIPVKLQAVYFDPSAPQGFYLTWARTEPL